MREWCIDLYPWLCGPAKSFCFDEKWHIFEEFSFWIDFGILMLHTVYEAVQTFFHHIFGTQKMIFSFMLNDITMFSEINVMWFWNIFSNPYLRKNFIARLSTLSQSISIELDWPGDGWLLSKINLKISPCRSIEVCSWPWSLRNWRGRSFFTRKEAKSNMFPYFSLKWFARYFKCFTDGLSGMTLVFMSRLS